MPFPLWGITSGAVTRAAPAKAHREAITVSCMTPVCMQTDRAAGKPPGALQPAKAVPATAASVTAVSVTAGPV